MTKVTEVERNRRADSVLRCITESPGLSAVAIGRRLGGVDERVVRGRISELRARGQAIVIGESGHGYYLLDTIDDAKRRAKIVRLHRERSRAYLIDHARLMRQIGNMTAGAIAQHALFDILIPLEDGEKIADRPVSMDDLTHLPAERRSGVVKLLAKLLDSIQNDPVAWEAERAYLAERYGKVFLTKNEAAKLAHARRLLEEIGTTSK